MISYSHITHGTNIEQWHTGKLLVHLSMIMITPKNYHRSTISLFPLNVFQNTKELQTELSHFTWLIRIGSWKSNFDVQLRRYIINTNCYSH